MIPLQSQVDKWSLMITFEVSIVIEKPVEEVFGFVAEGENGS